MEPSSNARPFLHPLIATAAISVIVLSAVGITAMVMNRSSATPSPYAAPVVTAPMAVEAAPANIVEAPVVVSAPRLATTASSTPASQPLPAPAPYAPPAPPAYEPPPPAPIARAEVCRDCGVVDSLQEIKVKGRGTGVGAVGGAVVGGLLGNMVGAGRGKALATVAGAVGGGLGGNAIEKNVRANVEHRMVVRLDNGSHRTFTQEDPFPYRTGERVRIVDGHVERS